MSRELFQDKPLITDKERVWLKHARAEVGNQTPTEKLEDRIAELESQLTSVQSSLIERDQIIADLQARLAEWELESIDPDGRR